MGAVKRPARSDPVAFGDLLLYDESKVREEFPIESDRPSRPVCSVVLEGIDVIDKAWAVHLLDTGWVPAGAHVLERAPCDAGRLVG
jgi:hypothetical protein